MPQVSIGKLPNRICRQSVTGGLPSRFRWQPQPMASPRHTRLQSCFDAASLIEKLLVERQLLLPVLRQEL